MGYKLFFLICLCIHLIQLNIHIYTVYQYIIRWVAFVGRNHHFSPISTSCPTHFFASRRHSWPHLEANTPLRRANVPKEKDGCVPTGQASKKRKLLVGRGFTTPQFFGITCEGYVCSVVVSNRYISIIHIATLPKQQKEASGKFHAISRCFQQVCAPGSARQNTP